jgi:hypothetical protein
LIGSLAYKMNWVGLFAVVMGVLNLIVALLLVAAIYRDKLPKSWADQVPPDVKTQAEEQIKQLPPNNHLWGMAGGSAVSGLVYLLLGVWTRSAAAAFKQIVDTQGRDISWLMKALEAMHNQYSLMYTLLVVAVLLSLGALVLGLIGHFYS